MLDQLVDSVRSKTPWSTKFVAEEIQHCARRDRAFTLIEVILALIVLSVSLITLLGLQSSIMQRSLRDQRKEEAMLFSRRLLAAIENSANDLQNTDFEGAAIDLLARLVPGDTDSITYRDSLGKYSARYHVMDWDFPGDDQIGIPPVPKGAIKQINLVVYWSDSPFDSFEVNYFVPGEGDGL